jgi:hypothetical protein
MKKNAIIIVRSLLISIFVCLMIALIADKMFNFKCYQPALLASFMLALVIINVQKKKDV